MWGSGCGSVGRGIAYDSRGPQTSTKKIFRKFVFCQLRKNKRKAGNCVNGLIAFCYLKKVYRYYGPGKQRLGTNTYILTYVPIHWGKGF